MKGKVLSSEGKMFLLPPAPDKCQECACKHEPGEPHNRDSLFYQVKFQMAHGRSPTWEDAMAHCDPRIIEAMRICFSEKGIKTE